MIDWALAGRISVLVVVVGWALYAAGLLDVIAEAVRDRKHEDALREDAEWDRTVTPVDWPPVPPILNQSERWQERARRAEALGFRDDADEETPTRPAA